MSSCTDGACGTGLGTSQQLPGDPDLNNVTLSAQAGFGGIALNWSEPNINSHAVAKVQIYRGTNATFTQATSHRVASGNYFFDYISDSEVGTRFYYWIQLVSVNATEGDPIGPASAVYSGTADQIREYLRGKVSAAFLDSGLSNKIDDILRLSLSLDGETDDRETEYSYLSQLVQAVQGTLDDVGAAMQTEVSNRTSGDSALLQAINVIVAQSGANAAAIIQERQARADAESAAARSLEVLQAVANNQNVKILQLLQVDTKLGAEWILKTDVNGHVAGVSLRNNGDEANFIVSADTFAVVLDGNTVPLYPFIVTTVDGEATISLDARTLIRDASITNAMIENVIQSHDYDPVLGHGWMVDKAGNVDFYSGNFRGNIYAVNGYFSGEVHARGDSTFSGEVNAKSLTVTDYLRIGQASPFGWETINTFNVESFNEVAIANAGDKAPRIVQTLTVEVLDSQHRVFIDYGLQAWSAGKKGYYYVTVRLLRGGNEVWRESGQLNDYLVSPVTSEAALEPLPDTGTAVIATDPGFGPFSAGGIFFGSHYTTSTAAIDALLQSMGDVIPPYGGTPYITTDKYSYQESGKPYLSTGYTASCTSFNIPVGNLLRAWGIHSEYRAASMAKSRWLEDSPGVGVHTYTLEFTVISGSNNPVARYKDRFIHTLVQAPIL